MSNSESLDKIINHITNNDLLDHGATSGPWIKEVWKRVRDLHVETGDIVHALDSVKAIEVDVRSENPDWKTYPQLPLNVGLTYNIFADPQTPEEKANIESASKAMDYVVKSPPVKAAALMPDACPTGFRNIPVGGIVASEAIHPGYHSADVCCSVFNTTFPAGTNLGLLLDIVENKTHFGPISRRQGKVNKEAILPEELRKLIAGNPLLKDLEKTADQHFGTQGDGNHFAFVGVSARDRTVHLITHHGSRGFGAALYKKGMKHAKAWTLKVCSELSKENAWIEPGSQFEKDYWDALQIVREWTKQNHKVIHDLVVDEMDLEVLDRYWNEHNFVFKKDDGLYYHAKGATPAFDNWAHDATDKTLIPLNMGAPVLVSKGTDNKGSLGFSPHGAGRNHSRTQFKKQVLEKYGSIEKMLEEETRFIDARFFNGDADISELPSAYKDPDEIIRQIEAYKLADIEDLIMPYGSLMNGEVSWSRQRKRK